MEFGSKELIVALNFTSHIASYNVFNSTFVVFPLVYRESAIFTSRRRLLTYDSAYLANGKRGSRTFSGDDIIIKVYPNAHGI